MFISTRRYDALINIKIFGIKKNVDYQKKSKPLAWNQQPVRTTELCTELHTNWSLSPPLQPISNIHHCNNIVCFVLQNFHN